MKSPLHIDIRIPFCRQRCSYCSESIICQRDKATMNAYTKALCLEIESAKEDIAEYNVRSMTIMGGTPALIGLQNMEMLMDTIRKCCGKPAEISIELNPSDVSAALLTILGNGNVTHYSVGAVTASAKEFRLLHRPYYFAALSGADMYFQNCNQKGVSYDLVYGLPGQTVADWKNSLKAICKTNAEHFALYPLNLHPGCTMYEQYYGEAEAELKPLPSPAEKAEMLSCAKELLGEYGFEPYTMYHFAKPGKEMNKNFPILEETDRMGFGLGAFSVLGGAAYQNTHNLALYCANADDVSVIASTPMAFTEDELLSREVVRLIQTPVGIEMGDRFKALEEKFSLLIQNNWLEKSNGVLQLTDLGIVQFDEVKKILFA